MNDFQITEVNWPDMQMLYFDHSLKAQIMQVHFWSTQLNRWIKLAPFSYRDDQALIVTFADVEKMQKQMQAGLTQMQAIKSIFGDLVA
jgi:hypothetical protein